MKIPLFLLALVAHLSTAGAMINGCVTPVLDESGNYYCEPAVHTIKYLNLTGKGTYQTPSIIDGSGQCQDYIDVPFDGPLGPYSEEITIVFRGPLKVRQFAAYTLDSSCKQSTITINKRSPENEHQAAHKAAHERRHAHHAHHGHLHEEAEKAEKQKRGVGDTVHAIIDGKLVSWINTYSGVPSSPPSENDSPSPSISSESDDSSDVQPDAPKEVHSSGSCAVWERVSYYNSEVRTQEGLTFLTHPEWTNTIAYAAADGHSAAKKSTMFNGELKDAAEMFINTDKPCSEKTTTECPYYKKGDVAMHGFGGTYKAFFFEFMMPDTGIHQSVAEMANKYVANNMPAIWSLNSRIMTNQYGCNCHPTGCGEVDFLEVLNPGNKRMKSTIHGKPEFGFSGGDSHYLERPTANWMSAWVVLHGDKMVLKVVEPDTVAPQNLTEEILSSIMGTEEEEWSVNIEGQLAVFEVA